VEVLASVRAIAITITITIALAGFCHRRAAPPS
jgi:hypothetical protein